MKSIGSVLLFLGVVSCQSSLRNESTTSAKDSILQTRSLREDSLLLSKQLKEVSLHELDSHTQIILDQFANDIESLIGPSTCFYLYRYYGYYNDGTPIIDVVDTSDPVVVEQNGVFFGADLSTMEKRYFLVDSLFDQCAIDSTLRNKMEGFYVVQDLGKTTVTQDFYKFSRRNLQKAVNTDSLTMFSSIDASLVKKILLIYPASDYLRAIELYFARSGDNFNLRVVESSNCGEEVYVTTSRK